MSQQQIAARIGARLRARLREPEWPWRWESTPPRDGEDARALARLRGEAARARRWLELASDAIGMPLPAGNGLNGPWHRIAVLDAQGDVGVLDIAAGRIAWTDLGAPSYVRRFAGAAERGVSPHAAGGAGGMGDRAIAQITLIYGASERVIIRVPRPHVREIEWGLTTCYRSIGGEPTAEDHRQEWARLVTAGVPSRETSAPQSDRWQPPGGHMTVEHAQRLRSALPYLGAHVRVAEGGVHHPGCRGEAEFCLHGLRAEREHAAAVIARAYAAYVAAESRAAEIRCRYALGMQLTPGEYGAMRHGSDGVVAARRSARAE